MALEAMACATPVVTCRDSGRTVRARRRRPQRAGHRARGPRPRRRAHPVGGTTATRRGSSARTRGGVHGATHRSGSSRRSSVPRRGAARCDGRSVPASSRRRRSPCTPHRWWSTPLPPPPPTGSPRRTTSSREPGPGRLRTRALTLADGLTEISIPKSRTHQAAEVRDRSRNPHPGHRRRRRRLHETDARVHGELSKALDGAACVLLAHPFLHPGQTELRPDLPVGLRRPQRRVPVEATAVGRDAGRTDAAPPRERPRRRCVRAARLVTVRTEGDGDRLVQEFGPFPPVVGSTVRGRGDAVRRPAPTRRLSTRWLANVEYIFRSPAGHPVHRAVRRQLAPAESGRRRVHHPDGERDARPRVRRRGQHRWPVRRP